MALTITTFCLFTSFKLQKWSEMQAEMNLILHFRKDVPSRQLFFKTFHTTMHLFQALK